MEFIIHRVEDVTEFVRLRKEGLEQTQLAEDLREKADRMEAEIFIRAQELVESNHQLRQVNNELAQARSMLEQLVNERTEEVQRSNNQARLILESITDGFFAVDSDWKFTYVNPQAERILDRSPGDLLGEVLWDVYPGLIGSEFEVVYRGVADTQTAKTLTAFYPDHDRWYEVHVYPIHQGVSFYFRDVTDRMRSEAEVERLRCASEQQRRIYETALSNSADFNYVFNLDGRFIYINEALLYLLGLSYADAIGKNFFELNYPSELAGRLQRQIQKVISAKMPIKDVSEFQSRFGVRQYEHIFVPVLNAYGEVEAVAGSTRDITEHKRLQATLRDADRRKDEFLATLAHELRNPLTPIRNSLHILKMPNIDAITLEQTREMMDRQLNQLVRLVDDLLDVSRVMRGKIELRKEKVQLSSVVALAIETAQPVIESQRHTLHVSLDHDSPTIEVDPLRISQVVSNLLTNAAKYTNPNGQIWVMEERDNDFAVLKVRDNGIGISDSMLPTIFDLFVQVDHAATRSQSGLGIGLTLAKTLVEIHGGSIQAYSGGLDKGCEFVVRLPLKAGRDETQHKTQANEPLTSVSNGSRLLVVDDNKDAALSLAMLLRIQGHEVQVANSGASALEMAVGYRPQMVILDIGMPEMDGFEVARRLRQIPSLRYAKLVALTGWGQEEDRKKTAEAGFDCHLVKPPPLKKLEELIAELK